MPVNIKQIQNFDFISIFPYFCGKKEMNFIQFRTEFIRYVCFTANQVYAWKPDFNKNNLTNWVKKGYLIKLKNNYYSFPEYLKKPNYEFYIANRIYRPSYISLHSALAFYGLIPEAVVQIVSITSLKTKTIVNEFGSFSYHTVHPSLMFGYEIIPIDKKVSFMIATPEKAILDLLYIYPFYNEPEDFEELRIDPDIWEEEISDAKLNEYVKKFRNRQLQERVNMLLENLYV